VKSCNFNSEELCLLHKSADITSINIGYYPGSFSLPYLDYSLRNALQHDLFLEDCYIF